MILDYSLIALSKGTIFAKCADFLQKNAAISKVKGVLVLKDIFLKKHMCVLTYQIPNFRHNSNEFEKALILPPSPLPQNEPLKTPP